MQLIEEVFDGHDTFYITSDNFRTREMDSEKYLLDYIGTNPVLMATAFVKTLNIFRKEKPDIIVSTGSQIAIPSFIIAKLFRIETIFIESWSRIESPSRTGKIVYPLADEFLVQWPQLLEEYGSKAKYEGAVI